MRISIKIKFSIFLAFLLLMTVTILSVLVLDGIKRDQQRQYEKFLSQQAKTANSYFTQAYLTDSFNNPGDFLKKKGRELAVQLERFTGQQIVLYDMEGKAQGSSNPHESKMNAADTLAFALEGKIAYQVTDYTLLYFSPLKAVGEQAGAIQLHYSLKANKKFYGNIQSLFLSIGAVIFILSFIVGYFYFNSFASGILKIKKMVNDIRKGNYQTFILKRRDELGDLSEGVHFMGMRIKDNIEGMEAEQKKLELAIEKLSALEKQQKQFIGNITHEFKTPLTSIKAYMDLLDMYPDDPQLLENARISIAAEAQRLYDMVDKVLELSALEKYQFEYRMEKVEISSMIQKVCSRFQGKMEKFGIELKTDLEKAYINLDNELMVHVLINLLDNAIKYNKPGGLIYIKDYLQNSKVYIEVSDTGIGIPEEMHDRIFEPFYIVDKNRSRQTGGTGLGLSLTKELVEKMDGTISIKHSSPEGTTFLLAFPAA